MRFIFSDGRWRPYLKQKTRTVHDAMSDLALGGAWLLIGIGTGILLLAFLSGRYS